jgi:recombination protein RecA
VVKNKVAPPFRTAEFELMHDCGISYEGDLLNLAVTSEIVGKSGAFFSYGDQRLGQGKENAKQYLRDNPKVAEEIRAKILEHNGMLYKAPVLPNGEVVEEKVEAPAKPAKKK